MSLNLLNENIEALNLLDWSILIKEISSLSHFDLTKKKLDVNLIAKDLEVIEQELELLDVFIKEHDDFHKAFGTIRGISPDAENFDLIVDIHKGRFFESKELHFFAKLIECYTETFHVFKNLPTKEDYSIPADRLLKMKRQFVAPLREFVDHFGNVSFERHPLLKKLYADVITIEQDLRNSITRVSKTDLYANKLQLDTFDIINDRYVLAIRSDSYNAELGPIVARSNSGMTLYVEPYEVRERSNKRIHLLAEIDSLLLKLTIELSRQAQSFEAEIQLISRWILELDWLNTKANYSLKLGLTRPKLNNKFIFEFHGLFHPLVAHPIKNNVVLEANKLGLIISGPNTGGKTVTLKSITLCTLLVHLGLFVPASAANIDPVNEIYYFSHDHQNLAEGLSSFASESKYYLNLLDTLGDKCLIVIDEIFNSTSSEEASALAIAFMEELHHRTKAKIVLSTHHQVLKTFMHAKGDYVSAHVGYDFESNRPTYKLITGEPGSSLAFTIFDNLSAKFGTETKISSRAKELLDNKQITYETLLQELSFKKSELERLISTNANLNKELRNQKAAMEGTLFLEKEKIIGDYKKKLDGLINKAEKTYESVKSGELPSKRQLNNELGTLQSQLQKEAPEKKNKFDPEDVYSHMDNIAYEEITTGMTVFSLTARKNVKILNVNPRKKEVQIQHGALSLWVKPDTLKYAQGQAKPVARVSVHVQQEIRGDIEVDCRGMRLEEFKNAAMQAIHEVNTGEIPFVTIIHGHGDGILKNWLRLYLRKEHRDLRWENVEGNDGCTKISF